ncbi:MAG TPA: pirin family protein [Casimicrobiaceae bacterium]|nr:pirin family protein [Casimicrobiaceae bacterium]
MIELVIDQRRKDLGGFEVGRVLPDPRRHMVGPFIFFDHMGPVDLPAGVPRSVDVRPHPHIGLATVTYLFSGEIMHRDSLGSEQPIVPAEVNWMTAGRGITHSERFERARRQGDHLHGIQAWVALPDQDEETEPSFAHHGAADLPVLHEPGMSMRLIAGEMLGARAKVKTYSPLAYAHCEVQPAARASLPLDYGERAIYVVRGEIEVDGQRFAGGQMIVMRAGGPMTFNALSASTVMLIAGEPIGRRYIEWNFVSSSRERIEQAKADWRAGRMKLPDRDNTEFIPLPPDPPPAANPMS